MFGGRGMMNGGFGATRGGGGMADVFSSMPGFMGKINGLVDFACKIYALLSD